MVRRGVTACELCLIVAGMTIVCGGRAAAASWPPIDRQELGLTRPTVDPDADAEAILWEVTVADTLVDDQVQTTVDHYLRIKIFTDRGREEQSRVDLPHDGDIRVRDVEARTVRRNGTTVEIKRSDVFQRDLVRSSGFRIKATSFVLPAVEPGGLVEYRWRLVIDKGLAHNLRLPFSRDIPVRLVRYHIEPLPLAGTPYVMRAAAFHADPTPLARDGSRRFTTSLANVRAFPDERDAPSPWEQRPWMLIYYDTRDRPTSAAEFWTTYSRERYRDGLKLAEPTADIRRAAADIAPAGASIEQKIAAALAFARARVKRIDLDTVSEAESRAFKPNASPTEALRKGVGTGHDLRGLFVAAARTLSLDARLVAAPDRFDVAFDPRKALPQLLEQEIVAVRDGTSWRFVDPTNTYAPDGRLRWRQEGLTVLIPSEGSELTTALTPVAPPDWSVRARKAQFQLSEDGTLEGDVTSEYTGHYGIGLKEAEDDWTPAEREESLRAVLLERLPNAEISNIRITNASDTTQTYTSSYHVKITGYAQRTGTRLFIQPSVMQKGIGPRYTASSRAMPLFYDYAWSESDEITIALPEGYEVESPEAPPPVALEPVAVHRVSLKHAADGNRLELTRAFQFGGPDRLSFAASEYAAIKRFFENVANADAHTVTLRKKAASSAAQR